MLAERLYMNGEDYAEPWNFGPPDDEALSVRRVVERVVSRHPSLEWQCEPSAHPHEAHNLKLDSTKARTRLAWKPLWNLQVALDKTLQWHEAWTRGERMREVTLAQIDEHSRHNE
jgi:CDP-glucose 4,6-dehydratase